MKLPSQKLFFIAFPVILIVGLFVLFHKSSPPQIVSSDQGLKAVSVSNSNTISEVDTDTDGVPDWEEALWHTDPNNPKTFNNKADADYINAQVKAQANPTLANGPITSTDQLGQQLFAEYISLKQSGGLTPDAIDAMTARLANEVTASDTPKSYTIQNLKTFPDSDTTDMQIYADTLAQTETQYSSQYQLQTGNDNATLGDSTFIQDLGIASDYYSKLAQTIMKMAVPAGIASAHVDYVNSLMMSASGLKSFADSANNPLQGMLGIKLHTDAQGQQQSATANITSFLNQNGIIGFRLPTF